MNNTSRIAAGYHDADVRISVAARPAHRGGATPNSRHPDPD